MPDRSDILRMAEEAVTGERERDYGSAENNFAAIAAYWGLYTGLELTPHDVAIMMALLKIARIGSGRYHLDNYVDLAGYVALAGEIEEEKI